jgi:prolipoprotein diacylglyceryltransferase
MFDRSPAYYPLQVHLILGLLVIAALLYAQRGRLHDRPGVISAQSMMLYGLLRLTTEPFRFNPPYITRHLNLAAAISLVFVAAGAAILAARSLTCGSRPTSLSRPTALPPVTVQPPATAA